MKLAVRVSISYEILKCWFSGDLFVEFLRLKLNFFQRYSNKCR